MRTMQICVCGFLAAALFCRSTYSAEPAAVADRAPVPTTAPSSGDAATDLVALFYKALLQEEAPTREQEIALFTAQSSMRYVLSSTKDELKKADGDMDLRRRLEDRAAAAGPIVLTYLREHKDWLLPVPMTSPNDIMISSRFNLIRSVGKVKAGPAKEGDGFVLAVVEDTNEKGQVFRIRTIVFRVHDGKIEPDEINLDGFGFKEARGMMLQERTGVKLPGGR